MLSLPMMLDEYKRGQTEGSKFNALIQGSYKGIIIRYPYNARLDYDPSLKRFVPSMAW